MSENVLVTHGLSRAYGHSKALDGVSVAVRKGEIYGLVGRNGAGKTTLMRLVTGQSAPTAGSVELFGQTGRELLQARRRTGAMIETPSFAPFLTARENLEYYRLQRGIPGKQAVDEVLELVDLRETGKKKFKTFSLGMKQRLGLALALMNHPDFLILDEPINGLDPQGIIEMRELILRLNREHQITVLISSHILDELARLATHYGFLDRGTLVQEISAQELEAACRKCTRLTVTNAAALCQVLDRQGIEYRLAGEGEVDVYGEGNLTQLILDLSQAGCQVTGLHQRDESLESYYMNLIGGEET